MKNIIIKLNVPKLQSKPYDKPRYNFYKTNFTELKSFVSNAKWNNINDMNLEDAWNYFKKTLHQGFELYVPKKKKLKTAGTGESACAPLLTCLKIEYYI